jgi:origin recognition complex subunit 3
MINVYDWFDSFSAVLESQRRNVRAQKRRAEGEARRTSSRTQKKGGKGTGLQKQREAEVTDEEEEDQDSERKWKMEVQARFMRALHELDYLGFLKHTGRKADHVLRTVFDISD